MVHTIYVTQNFTLDQMPPVVYGLNRISRQTDFYQPLYELCPRKNVSVHFEAPPVATNYCQPHHG